MGVSKNSVFSPKMDGENNGSGSKPYEQLDDLGVFPPLFLVQHPDDTVDGWNLAPPGMLLKPYK